MDHKLSWSLSLGRWVGVPVRVHALLLLFLTVIFCVDFNSGVSRQDGILSTAMVTAAVLIGSLVLHELAHIFAIHNVGGSVHSVMLMPWGGNSTYEYPTQRYWRLITILAGPFVNFAIFMFGATLLLQSSETSILNIVHPFRPHAFLTSDVATTLIQIITWINFQLLVVNLIPCFPFDGAELLRTVFGYLHKNVPHYRIESAIRVTGTAVSLTLIGFAWLMRNQQMGPIEPTWFVLLVSGIGLYFAARHSFYVETFDDTSEWDESHAALGLSDAFTESPSFFVFGDSEDPEYSKWLVEKQEARIRDELQLEQREIEMADDVLVKLHESGFESLTSDEKMLLHRVSERLRRKRKLDVID
jgi:Zn-dependent protease